MGSLLFDPTAQNDLLRRAQADPSGPAIDTLLDLYEPLVQRIARSLTSCSMLRDDLANEARLALTKAVRRHDLSRHGFAAYAEQFMRGAARRWLMAWLARSCDDVVGAHEHAAPAEPDLGWGDGEVGWAVCRLPREQLELLTRRYVIDESLADIAGTSSTSESAVSQRIRTAERAVRRLLTAA